jgi:hypothetical protein
MRRDSTRQGTTIQPTEKPPPPQIMPPAVVMEMPPAVQAAWTLRWPQMPRLIMLVVSPRHPTPTPISQFFFDLHHRLLQQCFCLTQQCLSCSVKTQEVFNLITIHKFPT